MICPLAKGDTRVLGVNMRREMPPNRPDQSVSASFWTGCIDWLIPILLAFILMAPRLISPQFGLFDDASLIMSSRTILAGNFEYRDLGSGRYRPAYWLHWALIYFLGGENSLWFFIGNAIELGITLAGIIVLIQLLGFRKRQAWISSLFYLLAGPVIENYYTLSKGEADQVLWLVLSLIPIALLPKVTKLHQSALAVFMSAVFVFLAAITKETTLAMVPISLAWCALEFIRARKCKDKRGLHARILYAVVVSIVSILFILLRTRAVGYMLAGEKYAQGYAQGYNFRVDVIIASTVRWIGWLVRDFSYLVPLFLVLGLLLLQKRNIMDDTLWQDALVWMVGWVAIFLPWEGMVGYFMLPFAVGAVFFAGRIVEITITTLKANGKYISVVYRLLLLLSGVLLVISVVNNITTARIQLTVDKANAELIEFLEEKIPQQSLLLVNIQEPNEYYDKIILYLSDVYDRDDIEVDFVRPLDMAQIAVEAEPTYVVLAHIKNQPLLTVRLGVNEPTLMNWNNSIQETIDQGEVVFRTDERFTLFSIDLPRLLCPLLKKRGFCVTPSPILDRREFAYGWEVVRLRQSGGD
jgi:hypothetical protein